MDAESTNLKMRKHILDNQVGWMISEIQINNPKGSIMGCYMPAVLERIMQIPVRGTGENKLKLFKLNNSEEVMIVRSGDITGHGVDIPYKKIMIMYLKPGESIDLDMTVTQGTGKDHPMYRRVEHVWIDIEGNLQVEPLKCYTLDEVLQS